MDKTCVNEGCGRPRQHGKVCLVCKNTVSNYGITGPQRDQMLADQDHRCAICENKLTFTGRRAATNSSAVIDHCHKTGEVRGILCGKCNLGLGRFDDNISTLYNAIAYLGGQYDLGSSEGRHVWWRNLDWYKIGESVTTVGVTLIVVLLGI